MKVIIAGSRDFNDYELLKESFLKEFPSYDNIEIVSGGARGADKFGEKLSADLGIALKRFPADWNRHGRSAGYIRNQEMANYADHLMAFWDGVSKGTSHMIDLSLKSGLGVTLIKY